MLLEDWCGDAVSTIPFLARLAEVAPSLDLRVLRRDQHPALMDRYLTNGTRSIPIVIVLDETGCEAGWWGPRPTTLQQWVLTEGRGMEKSDRYREVRRWHATDRGHTMLGEMVALLTLAAAKRQ